MLTNAVVGLTTRFNGVKYFMIEADSLQLRAPIKVLDEYEEVRCEPKGRLMYTGKLSR